jgi:hypothetical protein
VITCPGCGRELDRIDHCAIEHMTLDADVYRPLNVGDVAADGGFGVASETLLRCGYCQAEVPAEYREFFYRRWYQVVEFNRRVAEER